MNQRTIKKPFKLSGVGIHSGKESFLVVSPAPVDSGITFLLKNGKKIPALVEHVKETHRGTTLGGIAVVEHLLSAVAGLQIDNIEIKINGDELPVLDGSALPYAKALKKAGIAEQSVPRNYLTLASPVKVSDGEASVEALPHRGFKVHFMVNFPGVGEQARSFDLQQGDFENEIAPARTFGYIEEYELLKEQGLGRGAGFENALVLGKDGYINTPRFPDEPVRHKILDLLGDFVLLGQPLQAEIKAHKSGHNLNIELIRRILKK
jgi:UDP-3-O-acyl N-acetylglucosamine deacetylase